MGVTQCYVLLLSILRNYKDLRTDPTNVIELIEKFSFVYSAICKLPANAVENLYSRYARRIEKIILTEPSKRVPGKVQSAFAELEKDLRERWPSFEVFRDKFEGLSYRRSQKSRLLIKYILNKINELEQTGEHRIDFDNVNIEHILPQNPSPGWNLSRSEIRDFVNLLGNLTLVSKTFNSQIGNAVVREKVLAFEDSEIPMTRELVERFEQSDFAWGESEIRKRHEELADVAYRRVWAV